MLAWAVMLLGLACPLSCAAAGPGVPSWWHSLGVRDLSGAPLDPPAHWYVVIVLGQECPVSNVSIPTLNKLAAEFAPKGFAFVGAYVDPTADLAALRAHARDYGITFSTADDRDHVLVKAAGASYTPQVAIFDARGEKLYLGRIDDRVGDLGVARPAAVHEDLRDALAALGAGAAGPIAGKPGYGCSIPEAVHP